ncbi:cysteine desulfurase [Actinoplanes campanulatus]|uniref:Cysteine desulfurase n=1 Tax=Actinoplanes campanulatus TaxID=113559 RepID=A0A7W5APM4_9ACTN|nr:aminotransferase class V-fold PLP-dependent enzyme [Actinoplanes campanulatus]MBB3099950.1 cysteine desulfurase [Actinoplanes campanulatus]GGN29819.1 aminotransferase [Actinoplanes campanulatus]GID42189.1 aminotransferase [Actinoplanes campanulatus]
MDYTGDPAGAPAYLDSATAAPPHPVTREALLAALADGWADPSRLYAAGRRAQQLHEAATAVVAEILGVRADEVSFQPSGTAAAQAAVLGGLGGRKRVGRVLVHSAIEHSAVLHAARTAEAVEVGVDRLGRLDLDAWGTAVRAGGVALAGLISASHEVGTVQPVAAAAELCAEAGVPLFVDAAQTVGRAPVPPGWSLLSASAHKWGGPAGVGVLVVRKGVRWLSPYPQDDLYSPRHPGALSLPAVVAAAASLRAVVAEARSEAVRLSALVDRIRERVAATVPDVEIVGDPVERLPHLVTFSCLYVDGEALLHALDRHGFAVSSGSSCTSSTLRPSHVLEAMGVLSHGNVRVSLHRETTEADVERFLTVLPDVVAAIRKEAGI